MDYRITICVGLAVFLASLLAWLGWRSRREPPPPTPVPPREGFTTYPIEIRQYDLRDYHDA